MKNNNLHILGKRFWIWQGCSKRLNSLLVCRVANCWTNPVKEVQGLLQLFDLCHPNSNVAGLLHCFGNMHFYPNVTLLGFSACLVVGTAVCLAIGVCDTAVDTPTAGRIDSPLYNDRYWRRILCWLLRKELLVLRNLSLSLQGCPGFSGIIGIIKNVSYHRRQIWVCPKNLDGQEIEPRRLPKLIVLRKQLLVGLILRVAQSLHKFLAIELQHHIITCVVETFSTSHADKVCRQMLDDLTSHLALGVMVVLIEMISFHFFVLCPKWAGKRSLQVIAEYNRIQIIDNVVVNSQNLCLFCGLAHEGGQLWNNDSSFQDNGSLNSSPMMLTDVSTKVVENLLAKSGNVSITPAAGGASPFGKVVPILEDEINGMMAIKWWALEGNEFEGKMMYSSHSYYYRRKNLSVFLQHSILFQTKGAHYVWGHASAQFVTVFDTLTLCSCVARMYQDKEWAQIGSNYWTWQMP